MYLIGNPKKKHFNRKMKKTVIKELIPVRDEVSNQALPDVDVSQLGSGMKGIKNKLKTLDLHSNGKKKYDKFISLKL